ncbi:hypothetical protein DSUL_100010 [Desulfovibrionales bacterium]
MHIITKSILDAKLYLSNRNKNMHCTIKIPTPAQILLDPLGYWI